MSNSQLNIISVLLDWLEDNLDQRLLLDDVAAKAGFSKWYLQRMFKTITGRNLGGYTRERRLSQAAVALRLTRRSIFEIGYFYHFDSQQIFTRAFKRQFAQTPGSYRCASNWRLAGLCPPIYLDLTRFPTPDFIVIPATRLIGVTKRYHSTLEHFQDFVRRDLRTPLWHQYLQQGTPLSPLLYGLNRMLPSETPRRNGDMTLYYTTAWPQGQLPEHLPSASPVVLEGGTYARFTYEGPAGGLQNFIMLVYKSSMPSLRLTRSQGPDIERFSFNSPIQYSTDYNIVCEYLIPIVEKDSYLS
ncbi:helix-turn-helix domain-containing protein [Sodalis sp. RH24]|uniref:helix-turn-helix domain-containing protein n=1 Tax=unclassified Sodalis (in: enterobacteria) TaxID=2636512 RepID=UPI0039B69FB5